MPEHLRERAGTLALDRGYDSLKMIQTAKGYGITPIVDIRRAH
jgi:hypothetical protein